MKTPLIDRRDFLRAAGAGFVAAMAPSAWAKTLGTDAVFA
ncbi:MAG: twin-arginine translocation signal domain-containing protein, partial [Mesorhizobium sp.]